MQKLAVICITGKLVCLEKLGHVNLLFHEKVVNFMKSKIRASISSEKFYV
jgi:hypothetical protein